jgi:methionine sulfoxide reductase heme-binding subunit
MNNVQFAKFLLVVNGLVPLVMMAIDAYRRKLGANPQEFFNHTTGTLTMVFLLLTLAVTPLRQFMGWQILIKFRRTLGLYAFFYAVLHFFSYTWFYKGFKIKDIVEDSLSRPFITIGMLSLLAMVPLAVTSSDRMIKWMRGYRWVRLHRLVYYITIAALLHYWMSVKADTSKPMVFAITLTMLLLSRVVISGNRRAPVNSLRLAEDRRQNQATSDEVAS